MGLVSSTLKESRWSLLGDLCRDPGQPETHRPVLARAVGGRDAI